MDRGVRFGMICYGVVYLLVAWLALQLALGHQQSNASNKGALQLLGKQSFGPVLLWLVAIGLRSWSSGGPSRPWSAIRSTTAESARAGA